MHVELIAAQLPGRESRLREAPVTDAKALAAALRVAIAPHADRPFAFFGHSMGALLALELAHALRAAGAPQPGRLIVSGCSAPHVPGALKLDAALTDAQLLDAVRELQGTPQEVLDHPEMSSLLLPVLRADLALCASYAADSRPPLECPVFAYGGREDEVEPEGLLEWQRYTTRPLSVRMFPGGHFFIQSSVSRVLMQLAGDLERGL